MSWPTFPSLNLAHARPWAAAALVCMGGLLATLVAQHRVHQSIDAQELAAHERELDRLSAEITRRLTLPINTLHSVRSLYATVPDLPRAGFAAYVRERGLDRDQPGVRGLGLVRVVPRAQAEAYVAAQRADGMPSFNVRSLTAQLSDPMYVVERMEPLARNAVAIGLDAGSEPLRRAAMQRAAATGDDALSNVIALKQDGRNSAGLILCSPLYSVPMPDGSIQMQAQWPEASAAQRLAHVKALLCAPLVVAELLQGVGQVAGDMLDFDIVVHSPDAGAPALAYSERDGRWENAPPPIAKAVYVRDIRVAGVTLKLRTQPSPLAHSRADDLVVWATALAGVVGSLALACITWLVLVRRRQTEDALRNSQALLDKAGRIAAVGGWRFLPEVDTFEWTAEACRIFGLDPGQQTTLDEALALIHDDDRDAMLVGLKRALAGVGGWDTEVRARTVAGAAIWIRIIGEPQRDAEGLRVVGAVQDVTGRRAMQDELRRRNDLLQGAIEAVDEAFVLYDPDDRLVLCNDKYREIYALAAPAMVPGARFEDIIRYGAERGEYAEAVGRVDEWLAQRLSAHHQRDGNAMQQRLANGRVLRIKERRLPDGHTVGFRIDVTDLQRATDEARAASEAKSQFLANVSHEIRTPMNAILGLLTLLQRTPLADTQRDHVRKVESAARWMLRLLNDILDYSKAEAGKVTLEAEVFRLDRLLDELAVIAHGNVGDKPLAVVFDLDPGLPDAVVGDALRLQQVLINLVGNAIKFTPEGEVRVRVRVTDQQPGGVGLTFAVQDTGIGIAPEHQAHIFAGFTQAESSTTRRFGGTGLGLSICKRLVELMGGHLTLRSAPGEGSTFAFTLMLPLADGDALLHPPEPTTYSGRQRLLGLELLLVEDNPNNQFVARELLQAEGARVQLANQGREAVDLLQGGDRFDAVLMDLQMPVMDGLTATRLVRQTWAADALPIIAMTANAGGDDRQACLAAGMNDHVGKPFELDQLVDTIRRHTGRAPLPASQPPEPSAPPTPAAAEPPSVSTSAAAPGIASARAAALRRFGGHQGIYRQALEDFVVSAEAECARWLVLRQSGQMADAARVLHSAKGLAGTLGAQALAQALADLETRLSTQGMPTGQTHDAWAQALAAALPELRSWLAEMPAPVPAAPAATQTPSDAVAVRAALERLRALLRDDDMDAMTAMQALERLHPPPSATFTDLQRAVHALDFPHALTLCAFLLDEAPV